MTLEEIRELIDDAEASVEYGPSDDVLDAMVDRARAAVETIEKIRDTRAGKRTAC